MPDPMDFGPYGKGVEGYIHFKKASENDPNLFSGNSGCGCEAGGCLLEVLVTLAAGAIVIFFCELLDFTNLFG